MVLCPGVGGGFGSELLLLELISEPTSLAHPAILHFSFGLFGFCMVWFGRLVVVVQNAAGEDRTPDLRIMRPTRCQLRYCRMCWHCGRFNAPIVLWHLLNYCNGLLYRDSAVLSGGSRGLPVGILDSESIGRGPNPRGALRCIVTHSASCGVVPREFLVRILQVVRRFSVAGGAFVTGSSQDLVV